MSILLMPKVVFHVCLYLMSGLARLCPAAALSCLVLYAYRVWRRQWLQQEWRDYLKQWSSFPEVTCSICLEDTGGSPWHVASLPCCGNFLCWTCVRRHAESVIDDGRPEMLCPILSCQCILPDVVVRTALRRQRWAWQSLDVTGARTRRKHEAYTRWVLTSGLAASCSARVEDVIHCPGEECSHMWVLPRELRKRKSDIEPQSRWNPKAWSLGRHMGLYNAPLADGQDLRQVHCPKCDNSYCLLCSRPWRCDRGEPHQGKSCLEHAASWKHDSARQSQWAGAKPCPGCSVPIIRSAGCNHMTCTRCGDQWCWVCAAKWAPRHYSCRSGGVPADGCVVQ